MTDTPAIPDEDSKKIQEITDEFGKFKEHHKSQIDALKFAQEEKEKGGRCNLCTL